MADNQDKNDKPNKSNDDKKGDEGNKPTAKMSKNQKMLMHLIAIRWPNGFAAENWAGIAERLNMSESDAKQQWDQTQNKFEETTKGVAPRLPVVLGRKGKKRDAQAAASGSAPASSTPKRQRVAATISAPSRVPGGFVAALGEEEEEREQIRHVQADPFSEEGVEAWLREANSLQARKLDKASRREQGLPLLEEEQPEDEDQAEAEKEN